jgi:hypothetical protein
MIENTNAQVPTITIPQRFIWFHGFHFLALMLILSKVCLNLRYNKRGVKSTQLISNCTETLAFEFVLSNLIKIGAFDLVVRAPFQTVSVSLQQ